MSAWFDHKNISDRSESKAGQIRSTRHVSIHQDKILLPVSATTINLKKITIIKQLALMDGYRYAINF